MIAFAVVNGEEVATWKHGFATVTIGTGSVGVVEVMVLYVDGNSGGGLLRGGGVRGGWRWM